MASVFYAATATLIERDARARFGRHAHTAQNAIGVRVKSYADLLRGIAGLFNTHYPVTRREFGDYASGLSLEREFPAIEVLNFGELVRRADLPALERRIRSEALPGDPPFSVAPPPGQDQLLVLTMLEPPRNLRLGFGRAISGQFDYEQRSGQIGASILRVPDLTGSGESQMGMRKSVYRAGMPRVGADGHSAAEYGSVGIVINIPRLVQGVLGEIPIQHVRMTLTDPAMHADPHGGAVLFDSAATALQRAPPLASGADTFSSTVAVDFHGRPWLVTFSAPKDALLTGYDDHFPAMAMGAGFLGALLVCAFIRALTTSRRRAILLARRMTRALRASQARLQQAHQQLRRLAAHADRIKEGERKRIAREIHDDLGQNLLALRIEASLLANATSARHRRLHGRASATMARIDATIGSVRQIINELRPNVLDLGLGEAVEWQVRQFRQRTGLACSVLDGHAELDIDEQCALAFFRILQEALSNIARHAHASSVQVSLQVAAGWLSMTVSDDGAGMPAHARTKRGAFGLAGIEERIGLLGGWCEVRGRTGAGTSIAVSAPLPGPGRASSTAMAEPAVDGRACEA